MEAEQIQGFNERLGQWVASQGFWFQLKHSISGGGGWSLALFHLFGLGLRLLIALLVVAFGAWIYLEKRTGSETFVEGITEKFVESMGASGAEITGYQRSGGQAAIRRIGAEGTSTSFFDSLEAGHVKFDMGLTDGLMKTWDAGVIEAQWIDLEIKAGADSAEDAAAISEALFANRAGFEVRGLKVLNTTISWGYSSVGYGEIRGSNMKADRVGDGWRLVFKGGKFSQNWISDFEIDEMVMSCSPAGLVIEEGLLKNGGGQISFKDVKIEGGEIPKFSGSLVMRNVPLDTVLPGRATEFVYGSISGKLEIGGSTNLATGVTFDGHLELDGKDVIGLRDVLPLLDALDVVDVFNIYKRVDFEEGGFDLSTGQGKLTIGKLELAAKELMTLQGGFSVRRPLDEEVEFQMGGPMGADDRDEVVRGKRRGKVDVTLKNAGKATKKDPDEDGKKEKEDDGNTQFFATIGEERSLRREAKERALNMLLFDGELEMIIPGDAFEKVKPLQPVYPVDTETGLITLKVPLTGDLTELTIQQAEEMLRLNDSRERR